MKTFPFVVSVSSILFLSACASTPYTDRHQFMLVSPAQEDQLGAQAYDEVLKSGKVVKGTADAQMVERVGKRIAAAADRPDYKWNFVLVDDKQVNAFCLPGGRVAFYTGILPITKDERGIAVVMSHEVSHAIARHGAERMSQQLAAGVALDVVLAGKSDTAKQLTEMAYGVGVQLPFGRHQEAEADKIGLILMAKAGYDPRGAIEFWERMKAASDSGQKPPEFLSTHPSDESRIAAIRDYLPEALKYYKP